MAKVILKKNTDPKKAAAALRRAGIIMTRKLADGSYVCYRRARSANAAVKKGPKGE